MHSPFPFARVISFHILCRFDRNLSCTLYCEHRLGYYCTEQKKPPFVLSLRQLRRHYETDEETPDVSRTSSIIMGKGQRSVQGPLGARNSAFGQWTNFLKKHLNWRTFKITSLNSVTICLYTLCRKETWTLNLFYTFFPVACFLAGDVYTTSMYVRTYGSSAFPWKSPPPFFSLAHSCMGVPPKVVGWARERKPGLAFFSSLRASSFSARRVVQKRVLHMSHKMAMMFKKVKAKNV